MIQTYSKKKDGATQLTPHFKVREFACKDGSDTILISKELVDLLERIRMHFNKPVTVTSGYRTSAYDKKVGGSGKGYHTKGMAADIMVSNVDPAVVALYAQSLLDDAGGVECGCYPSGGYVHIDVRTSKWRAVKAYRNKTYETIPGDLFPSVTKGNGGQSTVLLQRLLSAYGFEPGEIDGICGFRTREAIQNYQRAAGLYPDGICGPLTWASILGLPKE